MAIFSFFTKAELSSENHPQLDTSLLNEPESALAQAQLVAEDIIRDILSLAAFISSMPATYKKGSGKAAKAEGMSLSINSRLHHLNEYLIRILRCPLSVADNYTAHQLLQSIDELNEMKEHLLHIAKVSKAISKQKHPLSFPAQKELTELWSRIDTALNTLAEAFLKGNSITCMWMLRQNSIVQEQIKDLKRNHIARLRSGKCSVETGMYFLELLFDYEQISSHCTNLFNESFILDTIEERKG